MKDITMRRFAGMLAGNVILALGLALFRQSLTGNDSFTALNIIVSQRLGWQLGTWSLCINLIYFMIELRYGKEHIGPGTLVNAVFLGYMVSFFYNIIQASFASPSGLSEKLLWMIIALIVTGYAASLYQASDAGLAPYDFLAVGLSRKTGKPFFACRIFLDGLCALLTWLLGGLVGIGTLLCALTLGPLISFFTRIINAKLLGVENKF